MLTRAMSVAGMAAVVMAACMPADGGSAGTTSSVQQAICNPHGSEVLIAVDTSARMGLASGYSQGSKSMSRVDLVVGTLKGVLPHLKQAVDFGLVTFPYDGNTDKNGKARVCPNSCGVGAVAVEPGQPYGWTASTLEHIDVGGNAAVGDALHGARTFFEGHAANGRTRAVVLFTGGGAQCGSDALIEAAALLKDGIPTYVFSFGDATDLLGSVAALAQAGGRPSDEDPSGAYIMNDTMANRIPKGIFDGTGPEVCDGLDNDCNGQTDENLTRACSSSCGLGVQTCNMGVWGACIDVAAHEAGVSELCDGKDNDCDGKTDEGYDLGGSCVSTNGACKAVGVLVCSADHLGVACSAHAPAPSPEVCNGIDDDCDGLTDEDTATACQTACGKGHQPCVNGVPGACVIDQPNPETCNGKDDDCDGQIDEGFDVGKACSVDCGSGKSQQGHLACKADGSDSFCDAPACDGGNGGTPGGGGDLCSNVVCPPPMVCFQGQCIYD